ncbi:MAG: hypothetical protein J6127_07630 [Clostridiales bacterium]|nr:hypothetical protein [Clostridiales bacterium]
MEEKDIKEQTAEQEKNDNQKPQGKGLELKQMANDTCIFAYGYIKSLKMNGHTSIGNLVFQEVMQMTTSANLASESIGRDRFTEMLESGYYATGRLMVYLDFCAMLNIDENDRITLLNQISTIHKIFAASVKTVRSRSQVKMETANVNV